MSLKPLFFLASLAAAGSAHAADPAVAARDHGTYFNRPGATLAQEQADFDGCMKLADKTVPSARSGSGGLMGALVAGVASGIRKGEERQRNLETCMVVRGWREIYLTQPEADALKAAVDKDKLAAMNPLVGAETIGTGMVGRVWANDFAEPGIVEGAAK